MRCTSEAGAASSCRLRWVVKGLQGGGAEHRGQSEGERRGEWAPHFVPYCFLMNLAIVSSWMLDVPS
jgi:hypothetical protein